MLFLHHERGIHAVWNPSGAPEAGKGRERGAGSAMPLAPPALNTDAYVRYLQ
jgi:hypothetical protein